MEKLKDNLPLISVFLIVLAITRLFAFYSCFNINISSYIDLTEVIQLQFEFLAYTLISFVITALLPLSVTGMKLKNKVDRTLPSSVKTDESMLFEIKDRNVASRQFINAFIKGAYVSVAGGFIILMVVAYKFGLYDKPIYELVGGLMGTLLVLYAVRFVLSYLEKTYEQDNLGTTIEERHKKQSSDFNRALVGLFLMFLLASSTIYSRFTAFVILTSHGDNEFEMKLGDRVVKSTPQVVYVGKTKNYVFLYDKLLEEAIVYPVSEIKEFHFKSSKRSYVIPPSLRSKWYKE